MSKSITYSDAGVSIDAANRAVARIKDLARTTFNARTLSEIGSFGGMFDGAFPHLRAPVLVASADGMGTKLKVAFETNTQGRVCCTKLPGQRVLEVGLRMKNWPGDREPA